MVRHQDVSRTGWPSDNPCVSAPAARRIGLVGDVSDIALRDSVRSLARGLGVLGWVRLVDDGTLCAHAEGDPDALDQLLSALRSHRAVDSVTDRTVRVEGHEQFAIRGVPAGRFIVEESQATAHGFELDLEVGAVMRSWAIPKGPSMDATVRRLAVQGEDRAPPRNEFEGRTANGAVIVWDHGSYEHGGRVPWPEALDRGHAVFVLHGDKLRGGFALQRTRDGRRAQWLLVKRRDEFALPGSDIVAELPKSVQSGMTLDRVLAGEAP
jgi:DNA ligase D-like protein (predicted 3'-phosphoesterase)